MKVLLSLAPVVFASISVTQPQLFDAAHMKETFKGIVSQGGEIDNATKANIRSIINLIKGNLTAALGDDYDLVISEFRAIEADLEACNAKFLTCGETHHIPASNDEYNELMAHQNCRAYEHTTCAWEEQDCGHVDDYVETQIASHYRGFPDVSADDDCAGENGPVSLWMAQALVAVKKFGPGCLDGETGDACFERPPPTSSLGRKGCAIADREKECTERLNGTYCSACDYASYRANCLSAKKLHNDEILLCDAAQRNLESAYCDARGMGCMCCDRFFTCWNQESGDLTDADAHAKTQIDLIHAQQTALECLLCYGEQIVEAGTNDFEKCDMEGCVGCSAYTYPESTVDPENGLTADCTARLFGSGFLDLSFTADPVMTTTDNCNLDTKLPLLQTCTACAAYPDAGASSWSNVE